MSLGLHLAKIRLSERKAKKISLFLVLLLMRTFGACIPKFFSFTLLRSKVKLTLFVLKDVVQVGHDGLQVFPNLFVIQFIDVFGCQGG